MDDINLADFFNMHEWNDLQTACARGNLEHVEDLLNNKSINIDSQDNSGKTALHLSLEFGNIECTFSLMKAGANVLFTDNEGETPSKMFEEYFEDNL